MQILKIPAAAAKPSGNIMDRVKTFEDACRELGITQSELTVSGELGKDFKCIAAHAQLIIVCKALNEDWTPDWANDNQYKYYPWFDLSSGSGLSYYDCDYRHSASYVGSRLCFKSAELAKYAANQFKDIYTDFFII
ncbi:MAG: hypothetical protein ACT4OJ_04950 [Bacteroidota bacterium]